jgi:hypothetical protein
LPRASWRRSPWSPRRRGVGQALIHAAIAALTALDVGLVFVLGHTDYYPDFDYSTLDFAIFGRFWPLVAP